VSAAAEDFNHGAGDGSHFCLLPTQLLDKNLNEGSTDYYENINNILDYGEFRHLEYDSMLRRGKTEDVIRSYDRYTQIHCDNIVQVTTNSNIFNKTLSKIKNDAIVRKEQELLTNAFLLDEQNDSVAGNQDIPVANLAELAVVEKKEIISDNVVVARNQDIPVANLAESAVKVEMKIIADNVEEVPPHKQNESAGNVLITNEEIEFQKKQSEFF